MYVCVCVCVYSKSFPGVKICFEIYVSSKYMQQETNFTLHGTIKINWSKTKYQIIRSAVQQKYKYFLYCSFKSTLHTQRKQKKMLLPVRCFTCGKVISNKWNTYLSLIQTESKKDALDTLNLSKICCRRMFLTNVELIDNVIYYQNSPVHQQQDA